MSRIILLCMVVLIAVFALMLGVIRSRAYFPTAVYAQLDIRFEGDDCPLPCWRGIRPGGTRGETAFRRLEQMDDVIEIMDTPTSSSLQGETRFISWRWTWSVPGSTSAIMIVEDSIVQEIFMPTRLQAGDVWLSVGIPHAGETSISEVSPRATRALHSVVYPEQGLTVMNYLDCPTIAPRLWTREIFVWLRDVDDVRFIALDYDEYLRRRAETLISIDQTYC